MIASSVLPTACSKDWTAAGRPLRSPRRVVSRPGELSTALRKPQDFEAADGDTYVTGANKTSTSMVMTAGGSLATLDSAFDVGLRPTFRRGLRVA